MKKIAAPCKDFPAKEEDFEMYPTLTAIVTQLQSAGFEGLALNPAFNLLEGYALVEQETGEIPNDADLDKVVAGIDEAEFENFAAYMECMVAFKSLKFMADKRREFKSS